MAKEHHSRQPESCGNCRYSVVDKDREKIVRCRRNPPTWQAPYPGMSLHVPTVGGADGWCGEWRVANVKREAGLK